MQLSDDQQAALDKVHAWYEDTNRKQVFYLTGVAGTGKTTLIKEFKEGLKGRICAASFTGKAALQMRKSGMSMARTIHSLIYTIDNSGLQEKGAKPEFILNEQDSDLLGATICFLDEVSMVNEQIGQDLESFGVPLLVIGDPGQLPPIKGQGYFTNRKPDSELTEIHRQALENPIIRIANDARTGKQLRKEKNEYINIYPDSNTVGVEEILEFDQVLVGKNDTRHKVNKRCREHRGIHDNNPVEGDKIICTKNNRKVGLFNGQIGTIEKVYDIDEYRTVVDFRDDEGNRYPQTAIHSCCWTNPEELNDMYWSERKELEEFDYGYAITVHKAQGSQWDNVLLLDDGFFGWDKAMRKRWLYTAITRAAERLTVLRTASKRR